jgi:N-formylglutamate amidohydrolase
MKLPFIIHIPHSSENIPSYEGYRVEHKVIEAEIDKLTDWFTNDLFYFAEMQNQEVIVEFSRVFCDVERFEDDANEPMAKFGMGVLYETTDEGERLRVVSPELRESILQNYYRPHHQALLKATSNHLGKYQQARIIDAHSFSNIPFIRDMDKSKNRPDICIGTDEFHTPKEWIDFAQEYFLRKQLRVELNRPYSGSIVPLEYCKDERVKSMMVEINRDLYLEGATHTKSDRYTEIKSMIADFLKDLQRL